MLGIRVDGSLRVSISQNVVGVEGDGRSARGNGTGIVVNLSERAVINDNIVSGNWAGLAVAASHDVDVRGNRIGTDATGTFAIPNRTTGVAATLPYFFFLRPEAAYVGSEGTVVLGYEQQMSPDIVSDGGIRAQPSAALADGRGPIRV